MNHAKITPEGEGTGIYRRGTIRIGAVRPSVRTARTAPITHPLGRAPMPASLKVKFPTIPTSNQRPDTSPFPSMRYPKS